MLTRGLGIWLGGLGIVCGLGCGADSGTNGSQMGNNTQPTVMGAPTAANPSGTTAMNPATGTMGTMPPANTMGTPPPTGAGLAGSPATMTKPPTGAAGAPSTTGAAGATGTMPVAGAPMAMDECKLHTNYPGDEYCILPPPKDKGFQLHIGPTNYDNPESQYLLPVGAESTPTFTAVSDNDQPQYFYYRQFRMRPGAHHNIITSGSGGDTGLGQRIGTANNLAVDNPIGGVMPPENKGVGIQLPAHTTISVSLHSINASQKTELREIWVNFWYRPAEEVTDPVHEVFAIAPQPTISPGQDITYGSSCSVGGAGRMLWMYGHRHAHNVRFSVWHDHGGKHDLVYQAYNWEEPLVLEYASTVTNAVPDTGPNVEGGFSGPMDVMAGDQFSFECHVINTGTSFLSFTNNTYDGEMCILDAEMIGTNCN
jgi:hypothetical protein